MSTPNEAIWESIPPSKRDAVKAGLAAAFGTTVLDGLEPMKLGMSSAHVHRIVVAGRPYLLRIMMRPEAVNDPVRHFTCLRIAAAAGLAPAVHHTDAAAGLSITDFVGGKPLAAMERPRAALIEDLGAMVRRLQAAPPFPTFQHYLDGVDQLITQARAARVLPAAVDEVFERYAAIPAAYPRDPSDLVPCHNDLNPTNVMWDGHRSWFVDWEVSSNNDRYVDPAYVCNQFGLNPLEEQRFLRVVFAGAPTSHQLARVHLMRQTCQMFFAAILIRVAHTAQPALRVSADAPAARPLGELRREMLQLLAKPAGQMELARALLDDVLANLRAPRFGEALRTLGA
jgi:aminoglycoside phosphotransferase (APT) family kinase protein